MLIYLNQYISLSKQLINLVTLNHPENFLLNSNRAIESKLNYISGWFFSFTAVKNFWKPTDRLRKLLSIMHAESMIEPPELHSVP